MEIMQEENVRTNMGGYGPCRMKIFLTLFPSSKVQGVELFWNNIWLSTNSQPFHMQAWNEVP